MNILTEKITEDVEREFGYIGLSYDEYEDALRSLAHVFDRGWSKADILEYIDHVEFAAMHSAGQLDDQDRRECLEAIEAALDRHQKTDAITAIHARYSAESDKVASYRSLELVIRILLRDRPQHVLELGGGVGMTSHAILALTHAQVDIYEDLQWCRERLKHNLSDFKGRYTVLSTYDDPPPYPSYDLVIIDGPAPVVKGDWTEQRKIVRNILSYVQPNVVYIDGKRSAQRVEALKTLAKKFAIQSIDHPNTALGKGGFEIRCHKGYTPAWVLYVSQPKLLVGDIKNCLSL